MRCPAGRYDGDSSTRTPCEVCSPGSHSAAGQIECVPCAAGKADLDEDPGTACTACTTGTYAPAGSSGAGACVACVREVHGNSDHDGDASTECETESHRWIDGVSPRMGALLIPFFVVGFGILYLCLCSRAKGDEGEIDITDDVGTFDFDNPVHFENEEEFKPYSRSTVAKEEKAKPTFSSYKIGKQLSGESKSGENGKPRKLPRQPSSSPFSPSFDLSQRLSGDSSDEASSFDPA